MSHQQSYHSSTFFYLERKGEFVENVSHMQVRPYQIPVNALYFSVQGIIFEIQKRGETYQKDIQTQNSQKNNNKKLAVKKKINRQTSVPKTQHRHIYILSNRNPNKLLGWS